MSIELVGGQLYQWETGRQLMIGVDASEANAIQFANQGDTTALEIEQNFTMEDGDIYVKIPDKCLQSAKNLLVYLVYNEASENSDEHKSRIFETKIFPVTAKPRPKNYIPIAAEEALGVVRRLTAAAKEAAMEAEEARVKAEAEKLYAEDAADRAEDAQNAAQNAADSATVHANNARISAAAADEAQKLATEWGEAAVVAAISAENHEALSYENSQAAADSKTKAEKAKGDAQSAATKAENAKATAVQEAEKAKAQAANAKNSADSAAASAEAAGDSARDAVADAMPQIMDIIDEKVKTKASINDTTIGPDAWSSNNIVDKLCPSFEKTGLFVQCDPVEGYPLNIVADTKNQVRFSVWGKNLYDKDTYPLEDGTLVRWNSGTQGSSNSYASTDYIPVPQHLKGREIAIRHCPYVTNGSTSAGIAFYDDAQKYIDDGSGTNRATTTVPNNASFMRFSINNEAKYKNEAQIEIGSTVTDYEPYWEPKEIYASSPVVVLAGKGVNSVFCYEGDQAVKITVTGKAFPPAVIKELSQEIEKLTNATISLGGII